MTDEGFWRHKSSDLTDYQVWKQKAVAMIDGLPAGGATIVVATNDLGRWLRVAIVDLRGKAFARSCRMIAAHRHCDCSKLEGLRGPVVVDASVVKAAKPDVVDRIAWIVEGANATVGANP